MNSLDTTADPLGRVLERLTGVMGGDGKYKAHCPAHEDTHPSLSVSVGGDGRVLLYCHTGCSAAAIANAIDLKLSDLFLPKDSSTMPIPRPTNGSTPKKQTLYGSVADAITGILSWPTFRGARHTKTWAYCNRDGSSSFNVARFDFADGDKQFRPIRVAGDRWAIGDPKGKLPLYRLSKLKLADRIFLFEGEKCADLAASLGLCATTSAHGARSARKTDWQPLAGKNIAIVPDAGDAGQEYANDVQRILSKLEPPTTAHIVQLPGLADGEDIEQWLARLPDDVDAATALGELAGEAPTPVTEDNSGPSSPTRFPWTDTGNSERLVERHGKSFRFRSSRGGHAEAGTWFLWDRKRWAEDSTFQVQRWVKDTVRQMYKEATKIKDDGDRQAYLKFAHGCESNHKRGAMISLAKKEPNIAVPPNAFDRDCWLLNCSNGTLDLRTGKLGPHRRSNLITRLSPVAFEPDATCPRWDSFLREIMDNNRDLCEFLQRLVGYCLTGDVREQILPIFYGGGANGKSVFIDTVKAVMGDYASDAPPGLLTVRKGDEHPTEIADLYGRRLVIASETEEGRRLRVQLVKRLTGDTTLKARYTGRVVRLRFPELAGVGRIGECAFVFQG